MNKEAKERGKERYEKTAYIVSAIEIDFNVVFQGNSVVRNLYTYDNKE
jgi:hypothetical protein